MYFWRRRGSEEVLRYLQVPFSGHRGVVYRLGKGGKGGGVYKLRGGGLVDQSLVVFDTADRGGRGNGLSGRM